MVKKSRKTYQKELIEGLADNINGFFSAEDIFKLAKKKDSQIGIATIYRSLNYLKSKNKINSYTCERRALYSKEKNSHCHYICEKTGKVTHFDIDSLDFLKKIKDKIPGSITSFQLEIHGVCDKCD
jgi:Fur family transcriptional regulator, ferric uptake regulator